MLLPSFVLSAAAFPVKRNKNVSSEKESEKQFEADDANDMDEGHEEIIPDDELEYASQRPLYSPGPDEATFFEKLKALLFPKDTERDIEEYVPNYRHTPILAGVIIPLAILLEIPGLTERWYIRTVGNDIVESQPNPLILNVGMGLSMACALVANIALIMRFLEKSVRQMTMVIVLFLTIHDIINIIAVTTFGVEHRFNDGFTYGQPFWVTVCATGVSTICNIILITDFIRTPSFDSSGSGLTRKQRSLVIMVIILLIYVALGALIHSILESLSFIDALYFTIVSIETIGFGDISPTSTGGRVFVCFHGAFGIVILALTVSLTRETVVEALEVSYRKRVKEIRLRRRAASWRRRVSRRWREAISWRLREMDLPVWVKDNPLQNNYWMNAIDKVLPWSWFKADGKRYLGTGPHPHGMHLNLEALSGEQLETAAMEAGVPLSMLLPPSFWKRKEKDRSSSISRPTTPVHPGKDESIKVDPDQMPLTHLRLGRMSAIVTNVALAVDHSDWLKDSQGVQPIFSGLSDASDLSGMTGLSNTSGGWSPSLDLAPRSKSSLTQQLDVFRSLMRSEERKAFYARLVVAWTLFFIFWMIGSAVFAKTEGWSFGIAMYFCFIAFSTIGFGDFSPKSPAGRSFFVVWALLGVPTMTILVSVISEAYSSQYKRAIHSSLLDRAVKRHRRSHVFGPPFKRRKHNRPVPLSPSIASPPSPSITVNDNSEEDILNKSHQRANEHLEALPHQILSHARAFHDHVQFFLGATGPFGPWTGDTDSMPQGLKTLLDEIAGAEKLGDRVKKELLQDPYARHTLFTLTIERGLRTMIDSAEEALDAIEERDYVLSLQQHENKNDPEITTIAEKSDVHAPRVQFNSHLQVPVLHSATSTRSSLSVHFAE